MLYRCFVLWGLAVSHAHAGTDPKAIEKLIAQSHPKSVQEFLSVAAQNPQLRDLFDGRRMFHAVLSSSKQQTQDPRAPRVILSTEDASLLMAVQKDSMTVEIIEFHRATKRFVFKSIGFDSGVARLTTHDGVKDRSCVGCHRGRPNWDLYPSWPGFAGGAAEDNDLLFRAPPKEEKWIQSFLNGKDSFYDEIRSIGQSNLTDLTQSLSLLNAQRIASIVMRSPSYDKILPYWMAVQMDCRFDLEAALPPRTIDRRLSDLQAETKKRHQEYYALRAADLRSFHGAKTGRASPEDSELVANMAYVAQFFDLQGDDRFDYWSLSRPDLEKGKAPGYYRAFQTGDSLSMYRIQAELTDRDPKANRLREQGCSIVKKTR